MTPQPYQSAFSLGTRVRVRGREELERFKAEWRFHHPLSEEQLTYEGSVSAISRVMFYHGGDPLYLLENVPGTWHEVCLTADS